MSHKLLIKDRRGGEREMLLVATIAVGRDPRCDISDADPLLSRRHAEFVGTDRGVVVRDLNSRNGILVNGRRLLEAVLHPGDVVQIAHLAITLLSSEEQPVGAAGPVQASLELEPAARPVPPPSVAGTLEREMPMQSQQGVPEPAAVALPVASSGTAASGGPPKTNSWSVEVEEDERTNLHPPPPEAFGARRRGGSAGGASAAETALPDTVGAPRSAPSAGAAEQAAVAAVPPAAGTPAAASEGASSAELRAASGGGAPAAVAIAAPPLPVAADAAGRSDAPELVMRVPASEASKPGASVPEAVTGMPRPEPGVRTADLLVPLAAICFALGAASTVLWMSVLPGVGSIGLLRLSVSAIGAGLALGLAGLISARLRRRVLAAFSTRSTASSLSSSSPGAGAGAAGGPGMQAAQQDSASRGELADTADG